MPTADNSEELERLIEEACVNTKPLVSYKKNKKIHIEFDKISIILACIMMLISFVVMCINIHYMAVLSEMIHQETEEIVEVVESTPAPSESTDIIPEATQNIPLVEATQEGIPEPTSEPVSEPEPTETTPAIDPDELEMLACVVYQEAGGNGSCDDCRRYVADIVLNRVNDPRFPNTMEEVLTAKRQYGRFYWTGIKWPDRAKNKGEQEAVARAYRIAEEVLSGQHSELYGEGYIWQAAHKQGKDIIKCCGHYYGR